jgi:glutathione S-transferase
MLMLDHKRVPYRRVDFVTGLHPVLGRLHGFDAGGQTRTAGGRRPTPLRIGDRLATVPGLKAGRERISTNHRIARFLDERHPEPPLFPEDPDRRARVEEVERWANATLQMEARRILAGAVLRDPVAFSRSAADGRMGPLLYGSARTRRLLIPLLRHPFATDARTADGLVEELPGMLDRIDGWIADGVIGQARLNAADCMVAPSLALILYRRDVLPLFDGRPSLELVDRLLPEPVTPRPPRPPAGARGSGPRARRRRSAAASR